MRTAKLIAPALLALAITLTGCGDKDADATSDAAQARGFANTQQEGVETSAPEVSSIEVDPALAQSFVESVRSLPDTQTIPSLSDEDLVSLGLLACERMAVDPDPTKLDIIDGEKELGGAGYPLGGAIGAYASETICSA